MPSLRHGNSAERGTTIIVESTYKCQINIGTRDEPRTCGEKLNKVNEYTFVCRKHGEVH